MAIIQCSVMSVGLSKISLFLKEQIKMNNSLELLKKQLYSILCYLHIYRIHFHLCFHNWTKVH